MAQTLEQRFNKVLSNYGRARNKRSVTEKADQERFSRLIHEIQCYGFQFEPQFYVKPLVEQLERLVQKY